MEYCARTVFGITRKKTHTRRRNVKSSRTARILSVRRYRSNVQSVHMCKQYVGKINHCRLLRADACKRVTITSFRACTITMPQAHIHRRMLSSTKMENASFIAISPAHRKSFQHFFLLHKIDFVRLLELELELKCCSPWCSVCVLLRSLEIRSGWKRHHKKKWSKRNTGQRILVCATISSAENPKRQ